MLLQDKVKGVVLAGGEGRRLRPLTYYIQKCMIPVGHRQHPLLEYIIRLMKYHGIRDISLLVGYKHEQIENYFDDGTKMGMNIAYLKDDEITKGTGTALLNMVREKFFYPGETVLIYYGDILSNIDLTEMLTLHRETEAAATLALSPSYSVPVGVAEVEGCNVIKWAEKPKLDIYVGIGIMAFDSTVLAELSRLTEDRPDLDITKDLIPTLIQNKQRVVAYKTDRFWYDVGSIEKYEKLENDVINKYLSFLTYLRQ